MRSTLDIRPLPATDRLARSLRLLADGKPQALTSIGSADIMSRPILGLLCSRRCPGDVVLASYDASRRLDPAGHTVLGGFHSPMERQILEVLLVRKVPAVVVVPRPLRGMRVPGCWRNSLEEGGLCLLSSVEAGNRRCTRAMAERRNALVAALSDEVFIPFAVPGGSVEQVLAISAAWGKRILTVRCNSQESLRHAGAIEEWLGKMRAAPPSP